MRPLDPRLVRRSRPVRRHLAGSVAFGVATAGCVVLQAALLASVVADGFAGAGAGEVAGRTVLLVGVFCLRALLVWGHEVSATRTSAAVKAELRADVTAALLADGGNTAVMPTGRLLALLGHGLDALDGYFARYLPQLVLAAVVPLVVAIAVLSADLTAAITIGVTLPLIPVFMVLIGLLTRDRIEERWWATRRLAHHFTDVLAGLSTLTVFGRARAQAIGLRQVGDRHRTASMAALRWAFLSALVLELIATLSVALVAVGVGLRLVGGGLDLRTALFVLLLAPEAYLPLRLLGTHFHDSADGMAAAQDAFGTIDSAVTSTGRTAPPDLRLAEIVVEDVTVTYPGRAVPALDHASLLVSPGETVAVRGVSGAGKSTLLALLLGLSRPDRGRVLVGGVPLQELDPEAWRAQLAWVPQRPSILAGSVSDNLRIAVASATRPEVCSALGDAGLADLDPDLVVGDHGFGLSAGQRRRIAVARALLRVRVAGARLLLLDEPTAGLDSTTELQLLDLVLSLDVTVVLVGHRVASLGAAERIISLASREQAPA